MFIVYGKENCGFCVKAKELLGEKGIEYEYIDVGIPENEDDLEFIKHRLTARSVPQILHKVGSASFYVGGYDDLVRYLKLV